MSTKSNRVKLKPIIIVQGGQWGSEAKGLITAKLCRNRNVDYCVRTGTVNAGHTVYYEDKAYKMQQLPAGWVVPGVTLVIGPGAYIHPEILESEIRMVSEALGEDIRERLLVDYRCGLHLPEHTDRATDADRHHKMGATGKGCSEAVVDKIKGRGDGGTHLYMYHKWSGSDLLIDVVLTDTVELLNRGYDDRLQILIEGTQGTLLDLHLGPYPFVTHKQCQAASWLAECGLSCTLPVELVSVMRTYPIRVAGNSGPMPREIAWTQLAGDINMELVKAGKDVLVDPAALNAWGYAMEAERRSPGPVYADPGRWTQEEREEYPELASELHARAWGHLSDAYRAELGKLFERTTVTNKLRRIAEWDPYTAQVSRTLNRPSSIALTFMNYVFPEAWGTTRTTFGNLPQELRIRIYEYVIGKQEEMGCPVAYVGFGPLEEHTFALYTDEMMQEEGE